MAYQWVCDKSTTTGAHVEQEMCTLTEHIRTPPVDSEISIAPSLVFYVFFVDCCLSFCRFSFAHCFVCPPSIYGF